MSIVNSNWIEVCDVSVIETDDLKRFDYEEKTFCIYKLIDGVFATDGLCTHEEVHLEDGLVMDDEIECPRHLGIFKIKTGKVLQDPPCEDLKTYPVKVEDCKVFINV